MTKILWNGIPAVAAAALAITEPSWSRAALVLVTIVGANVLGFTEATLDPGGYVRLLRRRQVAKL